MPIFLSSQKIVKDWIDYNNHMNVSYYLLIFDKYGADTIRLYMMFTAPPEQSLEWSESSVEGAYRFLKRIWSLVVTKKYSEISIPKSFTQNERDLRRKTHETIRKVTNK